MRMYNLMENDWSKIPEAKYDSKMVVKMVDDAQTAHHMEHTMYNSLKQTPQHKDNGLKRNGFDTPKHEENKLRLQPSPYLCCFGTSGRTNGPAAKCEYGCDLNLLESKSREYLVLLDLRS